MNLLTSLDKIYDFYSYILNSPNPTEKMSNFKYKEENKDLDFNTIVRLLELMQLTVDAMSDENNLKIEIDNSTAWDALDLIEDAITSTEVGDPIDTDWLPQSPVTFIKYVNYKKTDRETLDEYDQLHASDNHIRDNLMYMVIDTEKANLKSDYEFELHSIHPQMPPVLIFEFSKSNGKINCTQKDDNQIARVLHELHYSVPHWVNGDMEFFWKFLSTFSLINEPRLTIMTDVATRQIRKSAAKKGLKIDKSWSKISWNVGDNIKNKILASDPKYSLPLHFRRGHWKRANETDPKSVRRERSKDKSLWWTWIDGYWAGHPAFGFKKHFYTPKRKGNGS
tara:strand:+ start:292 stop:1302 length:1011 start_codon:yes stop_codon:yes gene_type:complete